jgi:O-antigen/teichoic acid export membrane protein
MKQQVSQARAPRRLRPFGATGGTIATGLLGQVVLIVSGVFAARLLGAEDRGHLALLVLVPAALAQIGALGLPVATTFYIAQNPQNARAIVHRLAPVYISQAALLLAVHAVILVVLVHLSDIGWTPALLSLAVIPSSLVQQYGLAIFQGSQAFKRFNALRILPAGLYALGLTVLEIGGMGSLVVVTATWVGTSAVAAISTAVTSARALPEQSDDGPSIREMCRFGARALIDATSPVEAFRVDQAVVGVFLSPTALGLYVVALAFTNLPRFISQSIGMVAYPRIAALRSHRAGSEIWRYVALVVAIAGAAVVLLEVVMARVVPMFFGTEFTQAIPLARILLIASFLVAIRRVLADGLRGAGRPGAGTIAEVFSWIILFGGLAVLTPIYGIDGVVTALALAAGGSLIALVVLSRRFARAKRRTGPHTRRVPLPLALGLTLAAAWIAVGLFIVRFSTILGASPAVSAGLLMAATAGAVWVNVRRTKDAFSVLNLVAAFYFFGFGVGAIYYWWAGDPARPGLFNPKDLALAASIALLGWLSLLAGYALNPLRLLGKQAATSFSLRGAHVSPLGLGLLLGIGWAARLFLATSGRYFHTVPTGATTTSASGALLATLSLFPTFVVLLIAAAGNAANGLVGRAIPRLVWALLSVEFLWYLPTGARGDLAGLALAIVIVRYYGLRRRLSALPIAAVVLLFVLVVLPFGQAYRGDNRHYQVAPREALSRAATETLAVSPAHALRQGRDATFSRFSDVTSLATIVHRGRAFMPRKSGETLGWTVTAWIPRFVLPDKPDPGLFGNEFGRAFGIIQPADRITSISVTQVGEMFLNYGLTAVVVGMGLVGCLYRLIDEVLRERRKDPASLVLFAILAWPLVMANETVVALGLFGAFRLLLLFACLLFLLRRPSPTTARVRGSPVASMSSRPRCAYD